MSTASWALLIGFGLPLAILASEFWVEAVKQGFEVAAACVRLIDQYRKHEGS